jgi:hypothetical protein
MCPVYPFSAVSGRGERRNPLTEPWVTEPWVTEPWVRSRERECSV